MNENFEPTIEMPEKLIAHLEGEKELTHEELTGGPIENKNKTEEEVKLESFQDIVNYIKTEYGVEEIKDGYLEMAQKQFENKTSNHDFDKVQATNETLNYLLEKIGLGGNDVELLKNAKQLYRNVENLVNQYKNKNAKYEDVLETLNSAEEAIKKTTDKSNVMMMSYVGTWKNEILKLKETRE